MKALKLLNSIVTSVTALVLAFMTVMVLLQVIFRYILSVPFPESQELAIYAMVYVVTFGSSIAVYNKSHVAVTFIAEKCPRTLRYALRVLVCIAMAAFFALLVKYGFDMSGRAMVQRGTATGIPVGYVMASIPVSAAISLLYVIGMFVDETKAFLNKTDLSAAPAKKE